MKTAVIIVAGGSGSRMGTAISKQFLLLAGKPLLMHTLERFAEALPEAKLIVVLPFGLQTHWAGLSEKYRFAVQHVVVAGGATRFHSVLNGLRETDGFDYIGVHDGVRPLSRPEVIRRTLEAAQDRGAAIPVVSLSDSLREVMRCGECQGISEMIDSKPVDRSRFVAVQTPQFFRSATLKKAYEQEYTPEFTDDASVVEASGQAVVLVLGDPANIKVTTPVDLAIAETLIKKGDF